MTRTGTRLAAATAIAAALSLAAAPASAGGRGHHGGHHDDDWDIDGGDVLAGVLILGGIAAISAIASSGRNREQSYPEPSYPEPDRDDAGYQPPPLETRYRRGGMAEAVDACVAEIETREPVSSVDRASRSGEGWYVAGDLDGGTPFACWVDGSGQVTNVRSGNSGASYDAPEADPGAGVATTAFVSKQRAEEAVEPSEDAGYALAQASDLAN